MVPSPSKLGGLPNVCDSRKAPTFEDSHVGLHEWLVRQKPRNLRIVMVL